MTTTTLLPKNVWCTCQICHHMVSLPFLGLLFILILDYHMMCTRTPMKVLKDIEKHQIFFKYLIYLVHSYLTVRVFANTSSYSKEYESYLSKSDSLKSSPLKDDIS